MFNPAPVHQYSCCIEEIMRRRTKLVFGIMSCCWRRYQRLQNEDISVCGFGRSEPPRNETYSALQTERRHCEIWNLGCFIRHIPQVRDPEDGNNLHKGTATSLIESVKRLHKSQEQIKPSGLITPTFIKDHIKGPFCGYFWPQVERHIVDVNGLQLDTQE